MACSMQENSPIKPAQNRTVSRPSPKQAVLGPCHARRQFQFFFRHSSSFRLSAKKRLFRILFRPVRYGDTPFAGLISSDAHPRTERGFDNPVLSNWFDDGRARATAAGRRGLSGPPRRPLHSGQRQRDLGRCHPCR